MKNIFEEKEMIENNKWHVSSYMTEGVAILSVGVLVVAIIADVTFMANGGNPPGVE